MGSEQFKPTAAEMAILQIIWAMGAATVREVHGTLAADKPTGYTTTLKLMQIMADKGILIRDTSQRAHRYRAAHRPERTRAGLLKDLIDRAFDGSTQQLMMHALSTRRSTQEELDEIRRLIDQLKEQHK